VDFAYTPRQSELKRTAAAYAEQLSAYEVEVERSGGYLAETVIDDLRQAAKDAGLWAINMPTEWGGAGEVRSIVMLYYGSFLRLSRLEEEWDWEEEIWETVTHEIRHHLESLALDDELEVRDYADDQNFARREGLEFEPFFFRSGEPLGPGAWEVAGDVFLERELAPAAVSRGAPVAVEWEGRALSVPLPSPLGDVHFVTLEDVPAPKGDVVVVLVRRRGAWESLRAALSGRKPEVLESLVSVGAST